MGNAGARTENTYEYTFTLSINGGEPQSIEVFGLVKTWDDLAASLTDDMVHLVKMNEIMGLKDWIDG